MIRAVLGVLVIGGLSLVGFGTTTRSMAEIPAGGSPTNGLLREYWTNLPGVAVRSLTDFRRYPLNPSGATCCPDFETSGLGENYGERLRGLLLAPVTGDYTFWIASDDASALWLSADDNPAHKHRIARVSLYTGAHDFTRYWEQRSDPIYLEAGKRYYIEAIHKQGLSVDHLSVAWTVPGGNRELISSRWMCPWNKGRPGEGVTLEAWTHADGTGISEPPNVTPLDVQELVECAAPAMPAIRAAEQGQQRLRGYLHPSQSGAHGFLVQGGRLFLSTDDTPADRRVMDAKPVQLEEGKCYYFEVLPDAPSGAVTVGWQLPDGTKEMPISARSLTPYDSDLDGMPDWYELRHGLDPYNPDDALAASAADGLSQLEEFQRGSNPEVTETFTNLPPILSVKQIREPATSKPVRMGERVQLRGVVTYSFYNRDFYLQDGTGGIYIEARDNAARRLSPGDVVKVNGVVASEGAAANIALTKLAVLGHDVLPTARPVALDPLYEGLVGIVDFAGAADAERVEIEGIVRSASIQDDWINGRNLVLKLITTSGQFDIRCPETSPRAVESWIDASIRVRGVASIKPQPRSIGLVIYAPRRADICVAAEPAGDLFAAPRRTIRSLVQAYWHDVGHRVGIEGAVLYAEPGKMLFIRDDTGAMQVFTSQPETARRGDKVRVIGFPAPGDFSAVLTDAVFQRTGAVASVSGVPATPGDILNGKLNCDLVTLQGTLVDHVFSSEKQGFWIKTGDTLFDASWNATNGLPAAADFKQDSVLRITGIAMLQDSGLTKGPQAFHLLLPSVAAVTVLQQPPWLTSRRLFWISVLLAGSILLGTAWVTSLSQKKRVLEAEVGRRKRAEQDLQQAHRELEKRMTAELREEIGRRERGEAEFQAVLKERTRIAQELHDTLEQGLVGIALQLDNVADVVNDDVALAQEHLESARRLVEESQAETRRSVWDLRSQTLEQAGLLSALKSIAAELGGGANVPIEVASRGTVLPLPVLVENNLFRIGQEGLTNALKHARPHRISVWLDYLPAAVGLEVQDDGTGFDAGRLVADGRHFGLQGIRERVKRLGGTIEISSQPNQGTKIRVRVPLPPAFIEKAEPADAGQNLNP